VTFIVNEPVEQYAEAHTTPVPEMFERLSAETLHHLVVEALVLAVEASLEVSARAPLEVEPPRRFAQHLRHERGPVLQWLRAESHP